MRSFSFKVVQEGIIALKRNDLGWGLIVAMVVLAFCTLGESALAERRPAIEPTASNLANGKMMTETVPLVAWAPNPADTVQDVNTDVVLSWSPGYSATSHDVYFGTNFDDVNNGDANTYKENLPIDQNFYDPCGLKSGTTYYWRIDEVNDTEIWPGDVWSFKVRLICGDWGYAAADLDRNCYVDAADFGVFASEWLNGNGLNELGQFTDEWLNLYRPLPGWLYFGLHTADSVRRDLCRTSAGHSD